MSNNLENLEIYIVKNKRGDVRKEECWCERGDSNSHGLPRWILSPVRLPVPPLSHYGELLLDSSEGKFTPQPHPLQGKDWVRSQSSVTLSGKCPRLVDYESSGLLELVRFQFSVFRFQLLPVI